MATTMGFWINPSFRIWSYVIYVEHISCVITNCGQHQWAIPSPFSIALEALLEENITRKLLLLSLDLFLKILLLQVTFLIFFSIAVFIHPATKLGGGYIGFTLSVCPSVHPSVRPSVRPSVCPSVCLPVNLSCPPCSIYSSGWILSIFGTNDQ